MEETQTEWPKKTREAQTAIIDSTRWSGFKYRDGDVVVDSWAKAGTTWVLQIVAQLIWDAPEELKISPRDAPWIEQRLMPIDVALGIAEAMKHRRLFKSHLPIDALPFSPNAKYIYIGRDARDVVWSAYNHQAGFTQGALDAFNNIPGRVGPPVAHPDCDIRDYYLRFLEDGTPPGFAMPPFWPNVQGWWNARHLPNVLLVHFNNLKSRPGEEIRRIAQFLDVAVDEARWPRVLEHSSFDYMKKTALARDDLNNQLKRLWVDGANTVLNKGTNGRWKDVLSAEEIARCDDVAAKNLTPDCAHWLKTGELPKGKE